MPPPRSPAQRQNKALAQTKLKAQFCRSGAVFALCAAASAKPGPFLVTGRQSPGRRGRLPVHAPLRTVLESFPSYGSSPLKARHILWPTRCLTRDKSRFGNLAILTGSRFTLRSFEATAPRRINRRVSVVICVLGIGRFHWLSCHFGPDRRGHIQRITAGVGFFGHPKAAPPDPPCGEVCPVARPGGASSVSMFCKVHWMI